MASEFCTKPHDRELSMTETYLALLRGINVGGKNKLLMRDLSGMFSNVGCEDVRTFIQSGNVVFRASPAISGGIPGLIAGQIAESFGYRTPVVLRSAAQLEDVVRNNPFLGSEAAEESLFVLFLADLPGPDRVGGLDPHRSAPDTFSVRGREVYLHLPNGVARSKLTNDYFDSRLATTSTGRNWRTTTKLLDMMKVLHPTCSSY
jgi:uncharacterized protein (DUF1697 family)